MFHVNSSRPFARQHKHRGQALVEFSLTLMVFLLLLFLIIEVARILQAYITVQHAARLAARYATAGQWEEEYADDLTYGWDPTNHTDPLKEIRPCWPAFPSGDPAPASDYSTPRYVPSGYPVPPGPDFYEPYRNPRTCSIEATGIKAMAGLALDPMAAPEQPDYYQVVVWGVGNTVDSTETFERGCDSGCLYSPATTSSYNVYYSTDGSGLDVYRGFGGDPQQKVIVKIEYWVRINTPILSNIAPAVRVEGTAIMTNESFGSTGLQREAILPSELPAIPSLEQPTPSDMVITDIEYLGPTGGSGPGTFELDPDVDATFDVTIANVGLLDATLVTGASDYWLTLYAYPVGSMPASLDTPLDLTNAIPIGSYQFYSADLLGAGQEVTVQLTNVKFPSSTTYDDYAIIGWIDSSPAPNGSIDEVLGVLDYENNNALRWQQETTLEDSLLVLGVPNLDVEVSFRDPTTGNIVTDRNQGELVIYRVQVKNNGADADGITVNIDNEVPSGSLGSESATAPPGTSFTAGSPAVWTIGDLAAGASLTLDIQYQVAASSGASVSKTSTLFDDGVEVPPPDSATLLVGAVNLVVSKNVVGDNTVEVGEQVTYSINVQNTSGNDAASVTLSDLVPDALSLVSASCSTTETDAGDYYTLECNLGGLSANSSNLHEFVFDVVDDNNGQPLINTVTVSTTSPEGLLSDNEASATVTVETADVVVTVDSQATGGVGTDEEVEFLITVENTGSIDALNVEVDLNPDSGLLEGATTPTYSGGTSYSSLVWTIGTLGPSSTRTLHIWFYADPATVDEGDLLELNAAATTTSYETLIDQGNNEDSDYLLVETSADLYIQEEIDGSPTESFTLLDLGQTFEYTLTVGNLGPDDTNNVVVDNLSNVTSFAPLSFSAPTVTVTGGSSTPTVTINPSTGDLEIEFLQVGQEVQVSFDVLVSSSPAYQGQQVNYDLKVSGDAGVDPDISNNTESHTVMIRPGSLFVNVGRESDSTCNYALTWGADDPILGENVTWQVNQPYSSGNVWGYWSGYRRPDDQPTILQSPGGPALTAGGSRLFGCRTETSYFTGGQFGYIFDDLLPGNYEVITIYQDTDTTRRFTVEASGDGGTVWNYILGSASNGFYILQSLMDKWGRTNPTEVYNVYDLERSVVPVDATGQLQVRFTRVSSQARVMGIGYRFYGPLSVAPLPEGFHEDDDYRINYVGTWSELTNSDASAGSYHSSTDNSAQISFEIDGDGLVLYRTLHVSNPGDMEVCIDGEASPCGITIDNSSTTTEWTRPYFITGLGAGTHLIVINNYSPVGGLFELDAVQVLPALTPLTSGLHEETDLYDIYNWSSVNTGLASGGSYYKTTDSVSSMIFQIDGDGADIISRTYPGFGMMEVCIDGEESPCAITIDLNGVDDWQVPYNISGLGAGVHTIVINNVSLLAGQEINIDAVDVP